MDPDTSETIAGLLIGCSALVGIVAIVGGMLHSRAKRRLVHIERMKALELGREMPGERPAESSPEEVTPRSPSDRCYSVAGKAVFWGFVFAVGAGTSAGHDGLGVAIAIAAATGAIGVTSVICGTILAAKGVGSPQPAAYASAPAKGYYDRDEV